MQNGGRCRLVSLVAVLALGLSCKLPLEGGGQATDDDDALSNGEPTAPAYAGPSATVDKAPGLQGEPTLDTPTAQVDPSPPPPVVDPNAAGPQTDPNATATTPPAGPSPGAVTVQFAAPGSSWIRTRGRVSLSDPNDALVAFPGAGFGARFTGKTLSIQIQEGKLTGSFVGNDAFNVFVDGRTPVVVRATTARATTVVATNLAAGIHTVWATKRADASVGTVHFLGFSVSSDGSFVEPPAPYTRRVEFVGASALSGYGVYTTGNLCSPQNADSCDSQYSYPQMAAALLGAEGMSYVYSGKGVYINISAADTVKTLPYMYERIIPDDGDAATWDFDAKPSDVVVIDAGGVDFQRTPSLSLSTFSTAYYNLVRTIRAKNPRAIIYCCRNSQAGTNMADVYTQGIQAAVSRSNSTDKDANVLYYAFPLYNSAAGLGCGSHPTIAGATTSAQTIAAVIKAKMKW